VAEWLMSGLHPISIIGEPSFKKMMQFIEPRLEFISERAFTLNMVDSMYHRAKAEVCIPYSFVLNIVS